MIAAFQTNNVQALEDFLSVNEDFATFKSEFRQAFQDQPVGSVSLPLLVAATRYKCTRVVRALFEQSLVRSEDAAIRDAVKNYLLENQKDLVCQKWSKNLPADTAERRRFKNYFEACLEVRGRLLYSIPEHQVG